MTTLEILRAARALIAQPGRWCQGALARNLSNAEVSCFSGEACAHCATGATSIAAGDHEGSYAADTALTTTAQDMGFEDAVDLNDATDLPTVLAMFDATIARLEGQGG